MDSAAKIVRQAREAAQDRQVVYPDTAEFAVLLRFNPIDPHFLRPMSPRQRWLLLTNFTDVTQFKTIAREPTRQEWAAFSWAALKNYADIQDLWRDAEGVTRR